MGISKELLKGSTATLILQLLERKAMYGYEMIKEMERSSGGVFLFKEGTLYPILHSLELNEMVEAYWEDGAGTRQRKYYRLTEKGRGHLAEKKEEWMVFRTAVERVVVS